MPCSDLNHQLATMRSTREALWRVLRSSDRAREAPALLADTDSAIDRVGMDLEACLKADGIEPGPVTIAPSSIYCYASSNKYGRSTGNPYIFAGSIDWTADPTRAWGTRTGPWNTKPGDTSPVIDPGQELVALDPAVVATLPAQLRDGLIVQRPFWNPHGDPQKLPPPVKRELLWMVQHYPQDDSYLPYTDDAIGFMNSGDPKGEMKKFFEHTYFMCDPPRNLHVSTLDLRLAAWHGSSTIVGHGDLFDVTFIIRRG